MTDERLRIWIGFWKAVILSAVVTGGVAIASVLIDAKHKNTELQIQVNREDRQYLMNFLDRTMDENLERRHRFAQYFANVTVSSEYKSGWEAYLKVVETEIETVKNEISAAEALLEDSTSSATELDRARERISTLQEELERHREPKEPRVPSLAVFEALSEYELQCPEDSRKTVWSETVSASYLPDFPSRRHYLTYGCRNESNEEVGPFVSWYPNGTIIEEGMSGATTVLYYPNGQKAIEGTLVSEDSYFVNKSWNPDGTERE